MSRSNDLILHRMKTIRLATIFLLAIVAIACQKQSTALTVEPSEVLLYSGGTTQLTAEPAEGVTYSSKDEFYAEVDASGLVTGNKVGETDIVASVLLRFRSRLCHNIHCILNLIRLLTLPNLL